MSFSNIKHHAGTKEALAEQERGLALRRSGTKRDAPSHLHEKIDKMSSEELDKYHSSKLPPLADRQKALMDKYRKVAKKMKS